ncbi:MAG: class I SAM-dependent methyltransferase [Armatimonadaceae bacterium]
MSLQENDAVYRSVAEGFADLAPTYDARMAGTPTLLLESTAVLTALPPLNDAVVADFGCGTGRYTLQLVRYGARRVVGFDLIAEMLEQAKRKANRMADAEELPLTWVEADLCERVGWEDRFFDLGVCALVLSFLPDPTGALREMARLMKPEGQLIVSDYHPQGLLAARSASLAAGRPDDTPYLRFTTADGEECRIRQYPHTIADLFNAAQDAGLLLEHIAEPLADRRLSNTYYTIRDRIGQPLALAMRFRKIG